MIYKYKKHIDTTKDFILPCKKGDLKSIQQFLQMIKPDFDGSFLTHQLVYGESGNRIYLVGLGEDKNETQIEETFRKFAFETCKYWEDTIQVYGEFIADAAILKTVIGLEMSQYVIPLTGFVLHTDHALLESWQLVDWKWCAQPDRMRC